MNPNQTTLQELFPGRLIIPAIVDDIPANCYLVYILECNGEAIVVGHGKKNRAQVILDDLNHTTSGHIKAIFVRLHHLNANENTSFGRYVITCEDKNDAKNVELQVQRRIGGNHRNLPQHIENWLFGNLPDNSLAKMLLKIAIASSFDGLNDLKSWRKKGIIDDETWGIIAKKLCLEVKADEDTGSGEAGGGEVTVDQLYSYGPEKLRTNTITSRGTKYDFPQYTEDGTLDSGILGASNIVLFFTKKVSDNENDLLHNSSGPTSIFNRGGKDEVYYFIDGSQVDPSSKDFRAARAWMTYIMASTKYGEDPVDLGGLDYFL